MKEQLKSSKGAAKIFVPFMIGAIAMLSGCVGAPDSSEESDPEVIGSTAQASTINGAPSQSFTYFGGGFQTPVSWPTPIVDTLGISGSFNNNGANVTAQVVASFNNGDPPLSLSLGSSSRSSSYVSLTYSGTETPRSNNYQLVISTMVYVYDGGTLLGTYGPTAMTNLPPAPTPVINAGGVTTAVHGQYISIYGYNLGVVTTSCGGTTLCGGVQVIIAGLLCQVTYVSPGQINAIVPANAPTGNYQMVLADESAYSIPYALTIY